MKKLILIILPVALICFLGGLGWGIWTRHRSEMAIAKALPLRVLCADNWLSNGALEKFSREHQVRIQHWTYSRPSDFLRQMANADGKVDVVCTSSLLVKSLVRAHWLKKMDYAALANAKLLAVDFAHLPYDPDSEYSVPLFWTLYGFFGKGTWPQNSTWNEVWQNKKISLWGDELNVLEMVAQSHVNVEQRLQEEDGKGGKSVDEEIRSFTRDAAHILKPEAQQPMSAEALMAKVDWVELPLARVARLLSADSPFHFWLPEDGMALELGVLAVGEKSAQPALALALINELISSEEALGTHLRLETGVLHASLSGQESIAPMQRPEALRQFPLNRLRFPDLNIGSLPRFQKIYDDATRN